MFATIANWISRFTRLALVARSTYLALKDDARYFAVLADEAKDLAARFENAADDLKDEVRALKASLAVAGDRLQMIADQETASANGTTKRMAKIAREGLNEIAEA
ncbi:hypothetical protein [Paracoccus litorisediminis]|uniref:Uncharacterized protein n=1 Tax=Paracoccus litorisediminis TaxID=2006130 RepID=A0A844HS11_9RHOB|nr:hypothetical protein [Paracoccus litorisediminis]MTH61117.1 hypothetical protein [Paracoccus litorisediminis]